MEPMIEFDGVRVFLGDCRDVLRELPDNSVDSVVTDPPYELGFMGKKWDSTGIAYDVTVWQECLRVLKPGGHILAFGGSRTWHRLAVAIEDAGFELRDSIAWMYGSGFPKSLDVSKAIDKNNGEIGRKLKFTRWMRTTGLRVSGATRVLREAGLISENGTMAGHFFAESNAGQPSIPTAQLWAVLRPHCGDVPEWVDELVARVEAEREVIGQSSNGIAGGTGKHAGQEKSYGFRKDFNLTNPATSDAQKWQGWGTALKPAFEPIVVGRKPLVGTVAENVLLWGVGGLNIDGSRIGSEGGGTHCDKRDENGKCLGHENAGRSTSGQTVHAEQGLVQGRWPANVILDEYTAELLDQQSGVSKSQSGISTITKSQGTWDRQDKGMFDAGRSSTFEGYGDSGGASRFFYVAKASKRDRNEGLDGLDERNLSDRGADGMRDKNSIVTRHTVTKNFHPTVKPTQLMRYLIKLVTPPGGTVLDPFTGSGSTGKAAILDGFEFVGVELTEDYLPIIEGRLRWAMENRDEGTLF